jgi:hypothetical protein
VCTVWPSPDSEQRSRVWSCSRSIRATCRHGSTTRSPPWVIDTHYRTAFRARRLAACGLYGGRSLARDNYTSFHAERAAAAWVRCKHYVAPIYEVSGREELESLVAAVPRFSDEGVFFRGQARMHYLQRDPAVKALLFSDSCSAEPSLPTSASRRPEFDYDRLHFALRRFVGQRLETDALDLGSATDDYSPWQQACASPDCSVDYAVMALAQHYGLPTHGLDVTTSLDVALWFALNRYEQDAAGQAAYRNLATSDWSADQDGWPLVFVCQSVTRSVAPSLHDCQELEEFGLVAARPIAQWGNKCIIPSSADLRPCRSVVQGWTSRPKRRDV